MRLIVPALALLAVPAFSEQWVYREGLEGGWDSWSWSGTYQFTATPAQSGTYSTLVRADAWGALSLHHGSLASSDYGAIEFFARAETNRPSVSVNLQDDGSSASSGYANLDDDSYWPEGRMTNTAWRRCYVPLSALSSVPGAFTRVNFFNNNPTAQPGYLIDNLRLTDAPLSAPAVLRASPTGDRNVLFLLDRAFTAASATAGVYRIQNSADAAYAAAVTGAWVSSIASANAIVAVFPHPFGASGAYRASVAGVTSAIGGWSTPGSTGIFSLAAAMVAYKPDETTHAISPFVYGVSFAPGADYLRAAGMTMNRWGGNNSSRYNWMIGAANLDNDWYFENIDWDGGDGSSSPSSFAERTLAGGAAMILSVPMLDWIAKDTSSHSFSVAKYGAQDSTDPYRPDAGNGIKSGTNFTNNNPTDASVPSRPFTRAGDPTNAVYQDAWLRSLRSRYGALGAGLFPFLAMDNESDIWGSTHRDIHPALSTYDELRDKFLVYATMAKSNFPGARILGPVSTGWWFFWNSDAGWDDKSAHGGQDFLPWFLDQVRGHDLTTGVRTLDFLDIHHYPNIASGSGADLQANRIRAARTFWDTNYTDEGWIGVDRWATTTQPNSNVVALIPRFRAIIANHYPGTRLALTEWNMDGGDADISGALSVADCLGIFGRERLDAACYWTAPETNSSVYQAFRLYGNVDGNGVGMEWLSLPASASSTNLSAYAARNATGTRMSLIIINKHPTQDLFVTFNSASVQPSGTASCWLVHRDLPAQIIALPGSVLTGGTWTAAFPAYSATLLSLPMPASADSDGDRLSDLFERAFTNATGEGAVALNPALPEATPDHDGDGITTREELASGTDPTDGAESFRIGLHRDATNWIVAPSQPVGRAVTLERAAAPTGSWMSVANVPWREPATNSILFFRGRHP